MADRLGAGQELGTGQELRSKSGVFQLVLQGDGNLVEYANGRAVWASHTMGKPVARLAMQGDGNLVLYQADNKAVWASNTDGRGGTALVVQDDGNVVIYTANGAAVWATGAISLSGRVRVRVGEIHCADPEDVFDGDELYFLGGALLDEGKPNPQPQGSALVSVPMQMRTGYRRHLPAGQDVLFDGNLPPGSNLMCFIAAFDEDYAKDWAKRPELVDKISTTLVTAGGAAIAGGLATAGAAWPAILAGAIAIGSVAAVYGVASSDKDDQLGNFSFHVPSAGPAREELWQFRQDRLIGLSTWRYTVRILIERP